MKKAILFLAILFLFTGFAVASDEFGKVDIHGFISQGYLKSDYQDFYYAKTSDGTFEFNEAGLNFSTQLTNDLRLGLQFLAKDLGEIGNDEINIDFAYADWRFQDWIGFRAGKMKRPGGLYNKSRDIDATRTFILLPVGIYTETQRESMMATKGVGIYGTLPGNIDYNIQYGPFDVSEDGGVAKVIEESFIKRIGGDVETTSIGNDANPAAEVYWRTPLDGLKVGGTYAKYLINQDLLLSLSSGPVNMPTEAEGTLYMGSVEYAYNDFLMSAEYRIVESKFYVLESLSNKRDMETYYFMASYRFSKWFELGTYYAIDYDDKDDRDGKDGVADGTTYARKELAWLKDFALCARFDINENWIVKLEGHMMDGLKGFVTFEDEPDWMLYAIKSSYNF